MDILGGVGDVLDTPGRFTRTALAGRNPFSTVFDPSKGVSGRELLQQYGMVGENQDGLDGGDIGGFLAEMALDPTNLIGTGLLAKIMGKASKARAANRAIEAANDVASAENRAMALAPRGIRVADDAPITRAMPNKPDSGIRGYLPDRSNEPFPGSKRRVLSQKEIEDIHLQDSLRGPLRYDSQGQYFYRSQEDSPLGGWNKKSYDELNFPTSVEAQIRYHNGGNSYSDYTDGFKGLNAGHALRSAAINNPEAAEIRLLRTLPKELGIDDVDSLYFSANPKHVDQAKEILARNATDRKIGAYAFPETVERDFIPSSLVEKLAANLKNSQSRVTRIPPSNEMVKQLQALEKIPNAKPLLAALLGQNAMARFGRNQQAAQ